MTAVVGLPVDRAFAAFTDDVDKWWRRPGGAPAGIVRFESDRLVAVHEAGVQVLATVTAWDPPHRLHLDWHGPHAEPGDTVDVAFQPENDGTRVTVTHRRPGLRPGDAAAAVAGLWWGEILRRLARGLS